MSSGRTLGQIDDSLTIERAVWLHERRAGDGCAAALDCITRLDALLDERFALAVQDLRDVGRGAQPRSDVLPA